MADQLVGFATEKGPPVIVEIDDDEPGYRPIGRKDGLAQARKSFESALDDINLAAEKALQVLRGGELRPDGIEIQFGVRFNAEFGAVVAKAAGEGHLTVKLTWAPDDKPTADRAPKSGDPDLAG